MQNSKKNISDFVSRASEGGDDAHDHASLDLFKNTHPAPPGTISINVSDSCNLKCVGCSDANDSRLMDYGLFMRIIDNAAEFCPSATICLSARGELFCHPRAMDMIRETKNRNFKLYVHTNGTMFGRSEVKEMISLGVDLVRIRNDALFPRTYQTIRGVDELAKVAGNIWEFAFWQRGLEEIAPPIVSVDYALQSANAAEMLPFIAFWGSRVHEVCIEKWHTRCGSITFANIIDDDFPVPKRYPCLAPWRDIFIDPAGNAFPCSTCSHSTSDLGSVAFLSLKEIWLGERMMKLREEMISCSFSDGRKCANCGEWNLLTAKRNDAILGSMFSVEETYSKMRFKFLRTYPLKPFDAGAYLEEIRRFDEMNSRME